QGGAPSPGGVGSESTRETVDVLYENQVTWNKEFNPDNRLDFLAGTSWQNYRSNFFSAEGRGYPDDDFLNNLSAAATNFVVRGMNPEGRNSLLSFYGRANYAYKEK